MFPIIPANSVAAVSGNSEGIFAFGRSNAVVSMSNLVSNAGVVASDVAGVGTDRSASAACEYGGDKGIIGFGHDGSSYVSISNLVSNAGVVASDVAGVGTARRGAAATQYDKDKGIFGYGLESNYVAVTNLVSNAGVVSSDQAATTGTIRGSLAACSFN